MKRWLLRTASIAVWIGSARARYCSFKSSIGTRMARKAWQFRSQVQSEVCLGNRLPVCLDRQAPACRNGPTALTIPAEQASLSRQWHFCEDYFGSSCLSFWLFASSFCSSTGHTILRRELRKSWLV